jgi:hypothetical protein
MTEHKYIPEEKIITYNDIVRSDKPFNWKAALDRVVMTPERLNAHIEKLLSEKNEK